MKNRKYYLWVDTETAGLQYSNTGKPLKGSLMELSAILTDINFNEIFKKDWIIKYDPSIKNYMSDEIYKLHMGNGLIPAEKKSKDPAEDVDRKLSDLLDKYTKSDDTIILSGNSIAFDKEVIRRNCPKVFSRLYYRILDVSSIKELMLMVNPKIVYNAQSKKEYRHRALKDIEESIDELKDYWMACSEVLNSLI